MTRRTHYDPKCLELAEHFLLDESTLKEQVHELAAFIQAAIEEWIECERDEREEAAKSE